MSSGNLLIFTTVLLLTLWLRVQFKYAPRAQFLQALLITITWISFLSITGYLKTFSRFDRFPPPFTILFLSFVGLILFLSFSKFADPFIHKVTVVHLILFQSFRILAELIIFFGLQEGHAPLQLSFHGYNFDIVTGITALTVGLYFLLNPQKNIPVAVVHSFNVMGLTFLLIILFIALTSMPTPLRLFMNEPSNLWVTEFPYILLPGILVVAAFCGHIWLIRKMRLPPLPFQS